MFLVLDARLEDQASFDGIPNAIFPSPNSMRPAALGVGQTLLFIHTLAGTRTPEAEHYL